MVRHAQQGAAKAKRKKPFPAGLDLKAIDLSVSLAAAKIIREILFVPPSMPAIDLLAKMQATRIHLALVIDEYGGTDGIVSMEDVVEQIVGDIEDEHDEDETPAIVRQSDGSFLADARAQLEDVVKTVGPEFEIGDVADEVDTLAGYVMTRVGRLPSRGEVVPGPGDFEIEVLDCRSAAAEERAHHAHQEPSRAARAGRAARRRHGADRPRAARRTERADTRQGIAVSALTAWLTRASHAVVLSYGLAARRDRVLRRRRVGAGARAGQRMAGAVRHLSGRWSG